MKTITFSDTEVSLDIDDIQYFDDDNTKGSF